MLLELFAWSELQIASSMPISICLDLDTIASAIVNQSNNKLAYN